MRYQFFVRQFFGFKDEAVVEVGERSARVWPLGRDCRLGWLRNGSDGAILLL